MAQTELAALIGVSQPRVSQVIRMLATDDAVLTAPDGYRGRRDRLLDLYIAKHRPATEAEAPWYGLDPMHEQVDKVCRLADEASIRVAVSADLAADLLAPWRHPTLTVVYADALLDLADAGFVAAEGRADATVLVRHTADSTLLAPFEPWPRESGGLPLSDPVQQVWDLHDLGGADRIEAADRLVAWIEARSSG